MNVKSILKVTLTTLALCSAALSPCYAARIYNNTDTDVTVTSTNGGHSTDIPSKDKSGSLDWTQQGTDNGVTVVKKGTNQQVCSLGFGAKNQITGGNYMVIEPSGNCFVCDSNRRPIAGNGSC